MKTIITLIALIALSSVAYSQMTEVSGTKFTYKNSVQAELFGHGLFYSLNYERIILNGQKFKTTAQLGVAYYPPSAGIKDLWIPLVVNEIYSFNKHHIELGVGHVFINESLRDFDGSTISRHWGGFLTGRLGYRYQNPNGRLIIRAGFTPFVEYDYFFDFHPSGGLSVGYGF
jgi:hypothetical protein